MFLTWAGISEFEGLLNISVHTYYHLIFLDKSRTSQIGCPICTVILTYLPCPILSYFTWGTYLPKHRTSFMNVPLRINKSKIFKIKTNVFWSYLNHSLSTPTRIKTFVNHKTWLVRILLTWQYLWTPNSSRT